MTDNKLYLTEARSQLGNNSLAAEGAVQLSPGGGMRIVLVAVFAVGIGCRPDTPASSPDSTAVSEAHRRETTDSVDALLQRAKRSFEHPDTTLDPMVDFLPMGDIAFANDGHLIMARDSVRHALKEPSPPNATMEFTAKKIDVLAPGVAAVTVGVTGRMDQGTTVAERTGVWSGAVVVRDGRTRVVQQHQSMKPGIVRPKAEAAR